MKGYTSDLLAGLVEALAGAEDAASKCAWPDTVWTCDDEGWCEAVAATALSLDLADLLRSTVNRVYSSLSRVPDKMLLLLHSPQGWTALAGYVGTDLGAYAPDYRPTVH